MVVFSNKKNGFSLVEALIVMLVLSIFLAASSKVITQKKEEPPIVNQHGQFECWASGSTHYSKYTVDSVPSEVIKGNSCKFKPTINAAIYHLYAIYNNQKGYYMTTISNITSDIDIKLTNTSATLKNKLNEELIYSSSSDITGNYADIKKYLEYVCKNSSLLKNNAGYSKSAVLIVW